MDADEPSPHIDRDKRNEKGLATFNNEEDNAEVILESPVMDQKSKGKPMRRAVMETGLPAEVRRYEAPDDGSVHHVSPERSRLRLLQRSHNIDRKKIRVI